MLPPCSLALAPCFLLLSASLSLGSLALAVCSHHFLPLADCNVFSDALPLAVGGVGGYMGVSENGAQYTPRNGISVGNMIINHWL